MRPHETVRDFLIAREETLSPFAARSRDAVRDVPEPPPDVRTEFQRDRDRIIHSKAFRRLKHKTHVFVAPAGDHFVTRLTHTLEVAQVARTIARALNLNEDLTEAIALAHDIGHTPFGHAGEDALAELLPDGFRHNEQSVRVVELLERGGRGLNLTRQVRDGILKHSKGRGDIQAEAWGIAETLEGQIVKLADAVAYLNHDIQDAIRAGLLSEADLPRSAREVLGERHSQRINTLVCDIVDASWAATGHGSPDERPLIRMSDAVAAATNELRDFMFERVYWSEERLAEAARARRVVHFLFEYFSRHPEAIVSDYQRPEDSPARRAADYISGMTDLYALRVARELGYPDEL